jgi:hypothetical protein
MHNHMHCVHSIAHSMHVSMHVRLCCLAPQEVRAARDQAVRSAREEAQRQEERLAAQLGLTEKLQREARPHAFYWSSMCLYSISKISRLHPCIQLLQPHPCSRAGPFYTRPKLYLTAHVATPHSSHRPSHRPAPHARPLHIPYTRNV